MRINQGDKFWVVVDAKSTSELSDILFETTIDGLERQFKGGLTSDDNVTIFADHNEAAMEAHRRMTAVNVAEAIKNMASADSMKKAKTVEFKSASGAVVFSVKL
jgi:hypothetical protein